MNEQPNPAPAEHLGYLDSARGIAAVMVMLFHFISWKYENTTKGALASIIFNGSDAVSFFFVLSGFVLSYKYLVLGQQLDIRKYYINRIFRLWPAFFVAVFVHALNALRLDMSAAKFADMFLLNKSQFWEEAILLRSRNVLCGPGWTLVVELWLSFFIPFFILVVRKDKRLVWWLLMAYMLVREIFYIHFVLGIVISLIYSHVKDVSFKQTKWYRYRYLILPVAFVLFSIRHINRLSPMGPTYTYLADYIGIPFFYYTAFASFVFIVAIIQSKNAQRILEHKILRFIGKISFGIYLMHWFIVGDIYFYWNDLVRYFGSEKLTFAVMLAVCTVCTFTLATLLHYCVELPFIRYSRRLTSRMKPSIQI